MSHNVVFVNKFDRIKKRLICFDLEMPQCHFQAHFLRLTIMIDFA